ncbi:MAG: hypothetical protein ACRDGF_08785, partial [Chloroflexota bacterium]
GNAINDQGQVVGASATAAGVIHAFLYQNGSMVDLGTLKKSWYSEARGINNVGQVVGDSFSGGFDSNAHAFLYQNGTMQDLGVQGGDSTHARSINSAGEVVGVANDANGQQAFIHDARGAQPLAGLGRDSAADSVNRAGDITGFFASGRGEHVFLKNASGIHDLRTLAGDVSAYGTAVNSLDQVVGCSSSGANRTCRAFITEGGAMLALGTLPGLPASEAEAISNQGQVVGMSYDTAGYSRAFMWTAGAGMVDLNSLLPPGSGWQLANASGINSLGQITGYGSIDGHMHAYIFTPNKP